MNLGIELWYQFSLFFLYILSICYGGTYKRLYSVSFKVEGFSLHSFLLHSLKYLCLMCFCKSMTAVFISSWYDVMRILFELDLIENEENINNLVCAKKDWKKEKRKKKRENRLCIWLPHIKYSLFSSPRFCSIIFFYPFTPVFY